MEGFFDFGSYRHCFTGDVWKVVNSTMRQALLVRVPFLNNFALCAQMLSLSLALFSRKGHNSPNMGTWLIWRQLNDELNMTLFRNFGYFYRCIPIDFILDADAFTTITNGIVLIYYSFE